METEYTQKITHSTAFQHLVSYIFGLYMSLKKMTYCI